MPNDTDMLVVASKSVPQGIVNYAADNSGIKGLTMKGGFAVLAGIAMYSMARKYLAPSRKK